jgi:hypothetical protein
MSPSVPLAFGFRFVHRACQGGVSASGWDLVFSHRAHTRRTSFSTRVGLSFCAHQRCEVNLSPETMEGFEELSAMGDSPASAGVPSPLKVVKEELASQAQYVDTVYSMYCNQLMGCVGSTNGLTCFTRKSKTDKNE